MEALVGAPKKRVGCSIVATNRLTDSSKQVLLAFAFVSERRGSLEFPDAKEWSTEDAFRKRQQRRATAKIARRAASRRWCSVERAQSPCAAARLQWEQHLARAELD